MKRYIILLVLCILLFTGCEKKDVKEEIKTQVVAINELAFTPSNEEENLLAMVEESEEFTPVDEITTTTSTTSATNHNTTTTSINNTNATNSINNQPKKEVKNQTTTTEVITTTTTTTVNSNNGLTESSVYNTLMSFKSIYPSYTPWTNDDYYEWNGGVYKGGYGCAGFAFKLSDAAFGTRKAKKVYNFDDVKVGDIIRYLNDTHSVIVLEVYDNGYRIAEANVSINGGSGVVYWPNALLTKEEVRQTGNYLLTRW